MSIAVSTVVKPSRALLILAGGACIGAMFIGALAATTQIGNWLLLPRLMLASACIFLALFGLCRIAKYRRTRHIDISGSGLIRVREKVESKMENSRVVARESYEVVRLLANSTLWPGLLMLLLQTENRRIIVLPILRDCVPEDDFRALAAACRWIAARNNSSEGKIL